LPINKFLTIQNHQIKLKGIRDKGEVNRDYRCEDGRFQVPASCVTISNLDLHSNSETGFNSGMKMKNALLGLSSMSESHWWHLFHEEGKSWDSTTWFRIWQLQTPAWKPYLQKHLLANRFNFCG
jgi:hypothetical protein